MRKELRRLVMAALIAAPTVSQSVPVTYLLTGTLAGTGTFTIDVGVPLGDYSATSFSGGSDVYGGWTSVEFFADSGEPPGLLFWFDPTTALELFGIAIGGSLLHPEILPGSTASAEWANFLREGSGVITPIPEPETLSLLALGIGALTLWRRRPSPP